MNITDIVIATSLVLILLVFIRISWTLKDICEALSSRRSDSSKIKDDLTSLAKSEVKTPFNLQEEAIDETEIAAVIAVASAAMRAAV